MREEMRRAPGPGSTATVTALLGICIVPAVFAATPRAALAQAPPCSEDVRTVEANGTTLHYFECGEGEPVVFVHGTTGDFGWAIVPEAGHVMFTNRTFFDDAVLTFLRDNQ